MTEAQKAFEALMRVEGKSDLAFRNGKYQSGTVQIRWRWFLTGWEMKGLAK